MKLWAGVSFTDPIYLGGGNARALRREAGRGDEPFECIAPILSSPTPDVYARLAEKGMTAGVAWPASLALGIANPSLEQEFSYLEQFSENTIRKQAS